MPKTFADYLKIGAFLSTFATAGHQLDHGTGLTGLLDDDHTQYLLLAGRAGGQTAIGGTVAGNALTLEASAAAGGGLIETSHPIRSNYSEGNTTPAEQTGFGIWEPTFTTAGAYIGQMFRNDATITYTNSFYIYASVLDRSEHISNAAAGFQAFTLFNALPLIRNGTSNDLVQMLVLNDGGVHERSTAGTSTATQHVTVSGAPQIRALVSGAVMTWTTGAKGLSWAPKFSTAAGSTVNMGTLCAVDVTAPAAALFQPSAGTENVTNIYGLNFNAHTTVVSGEIAVIHSSMVAAAGRYFLKNDGGAQSTFNDGNLFDCGFVQILSNTKTLSLGASGGNWQIGFDATGLLHNPLVGDSYRYTAATNVTTITGLGSAHEYRMNFARGIHFGSSGALGNQIYNLTANAIGTNAAGEWATVLLTQAGNLTINHAMTAVYAWVVNATSLTSGTGSITGVIATFNVGGMTTSGVGSNETVGFRTQGRTQLRGTVQYVVIEPAELSGTINAWNGLLTASPNNGTRYRARITVAAGAVLNGIDATHAFDGDTYEIISEDTADNLTVNNLSGSAAAGERILLGNNFGGTFAPDDVLVIMYDDDIDSGSGGWRVTHYN